MNGGPGRIDQRCVSRGGPGRGKRVDKRGSRKRGSDKDSPQASDELPRKRSRESSEVKQAGPMCKKPKDSIKSAAAAPATTQATHQVSALEPTDAPKPNMVGSAGTVPINRESENNDPEVTGTASSKQLMTSVVKRKDIDDGENKALKQIQTLDLTKMNPDTLIGARIKKQFENFGAFEGQVVSHDVDMTGKTIYRIKYQDGDQEDLFLSELTPLIRSCDC